MKVFNCHYENTKQLQDYISTHIKQPYTSLLVQLFSGEMDKGKVQNILDEVHSQLPQATIIGSSTAGEILKGELFDKSIVLSFSLFQSTTLQTHYINSVNQISGMNTPEEIIKDDSKAIICFSETFSSDAENFFKGFDTVNNEIVIAGGNAGDNGSFKSSFIICDGKIYDVGMVLCVLNSKTLQVNNEYALNWTPLGRKMVVTKVRNNTVYELDNKPILEVYRYYFGDTILNYLPQSIVEFPLLKREEKISIARSVISINEDKSFVFAGHFSEGESVQFSFGHVDDILNNAKLLSQGVVKKPAQALFIYSCSVRKSFLGHDLNREFECLENIAPTVGFFTYGEFFHTGKSHQVLNISTTVLALSETNTIKDISSLSRQELEYSTLHSLTHLMNVSERELEEKTQALLESSHFAQLGEMISMIAHQWRQPLSAITVGLSAAKIKMQMGQLDEETMTVLVDNMETSAKKLSDTINMFSNFLDTDDTVNYINLESVIKEALSLIEDSLHNYEIVLSLDIDKDIILNIKAQDFKHVLLSLLKNAQDVLVEYKVFKPKIDLRAYAQDGNVVIEVEDNGGGIKASQIKDIFDPYFTTKQIKNGAGLGLYVSKVVIEQHCKGLLSASNTDAGACFKIELKN